MFSARLFVPALILCLPLAALCPAYAGGDPEPAAEPATRVFLPAPGDLETRDRWDDYMHAFEDAIEKCSTPWAPWYIVPANRKWYRNLVVSTVLVETLENLDLCYPAPVEDIEKYEIKP